MLIWVFKSWRRLFPGSFFSSRPWKVASSSPTMPTTTSFASIRPSMTSSVGAGCPSPSSATFSWYRTTPSDEAAQSCNSFCLSESKNNYFRDPLKFPNRRNFPDFLCFFLFLYSSLFSGQNKSIIILNNVFWRRNDLAQEWKFIESDFVHGWCHWRSRHCTFRGIQGVWLSVEVKRCVCIRRSKPSVEFLPPWWLPPTGSSWF